MPGPLLHVGANILCAHAGQAQPAVPNTRVLVGGQPTVLLNCLYTVTGCTMPPPSSGNGPCVSAQWISAATRITSNGQPLLLMDSQSICTPTGTPLMPVAVQTRVSGI